ncbi:reverse transcriptase domain-containing protein, partial [Tanacetum coccineum]
MMEKVLADQRGQNIEVYLEEIMVKSKSEQGLVQDIKETLRKLKRVNIKIDSNTSSFEVEEGRFRGHMVTKEGVRVNPEKVQATIRSPTPKGPNQIRSLFLQLTTIDKFIPKLAELKYPINKVRMRMDAATKGGADAMPATEKSDDKLRSDGRKGRIPSTSLLCVGIILVSPDEKMHSYVIRLKFNASDHAMDYEALLAGLVAYVSKGMKELHVFIDLLTLIAQIEGNHMPATEHERSVNEVGNHKARISQPRSFGGYQDKTINQSGKSSTQ